MQRILATAFFLIVAAFATANAQPSSIQVDDAWSRATLGQSRTGAAYLTLATRAANADRLVSASATVAGKVELHNHIMVGNVAQMRPVDAIEVAPGSPTVLQPGGLHIMLLDLKAPLQAGTSFPLTLVFEKAGAVTVNVAVRAVRAPQGHAH
jgi:periplasmic copper chaperone A